MKLVAWLVALPVAFVGIVIAIANRSPVRFSIDPVTPDSSPLGVEAPLYVLIFVSIFIGMLIGGGTTWVKQHKWRKTARLERKQKDALASELASTTAPASRGMQVELSPKDKAA